MKIAVGEPRPRPVGSQEVQDAIVLHIVIAARTLLSVTVELVILVKSATTAVMVLTEPVDPVAKDIFSMRIPIAPVQVKLVLYHFLLALFHFRICFALLFECD